MKVSGLCALFHTSLERVKRDSFSPYPFTLRAKQKTKQKYKKHCHCRFPFSLRVQTFAVDALYISLSRSSESLYLEAFPIFKTKEKLKWKKKKNLLQSLKNYGIRLLQHFLFGLSFRPPKMYNHRCCHVGSDFLASNLVLPKSIYT